MHGLGVDVRTLRDDTALMAYLLDPGEGKYQLEDLALRYLSLEVTSPDVEAGTLDLDGESGIQETARRAAAILRLADALEEALASRQLTDLYERFERPLVRVLAKMETSGIKVDRKFLDELRADLAKQCEALVQRIWAHAGEEFNVNSTPQLREVLFDELGLTPQKKTKTGYSTDAASLEKLSGLHPIIEHLLAYREVEKLRSTYGEGLLSAVGPDGRIHATFQQTVARTGRLSSDAPNLHNIPVRSEVGRTFRAAFVPARGYEFLVADYNQIELRCIAHLAADPGLIEAFRSGVDIHNATASRRGRTSEWTASRARGVGRRTRRGTPPRPDPQCPSMRAACRGP